MFCLTRLIVGKNVRSRLVSQLFAVMLLLLVWGVGMSVAAAASEIGTLLPPADFLKGWVMTGKPELYTPDTLYKHINGEAELYLPYGFENLEFALYAKDIDKQTALAVDVYRMRSLLDAFGIYSNYRDPDAAPVKVGAEGFATDSQLMFYQDRYFVQLTSSGSGTPGRGVFIACAEAIAKKLPNPPVQPREKALLNGPGVAKDTVKYVAVSLLGYRFFNRGMTAQATLDSKTIKAFVVINDSADAARTTFDQYTDYLKQAGNVPQISRTKNAVTLTGRDPLYKGMVVRQRGPYLFGVSNLEDLGRGVSFLDRWVMSEEKGKVLEHRP